MTQLFVQYPNLREFFDLPDASVQQRAACFAVLAHRALMDEIYETFAGRWEQSPPLGDEEKDVHTRMQNLFSADAPAWVLELNEVAELLPSRVYDALPEPLRRGGFNASGDAAQAEVISSAASKLSNVQEIQALIQKVLDQQLQRLERRWSATKVRVRGPNKRKGWQQKIKLYDVIRRVLSENRKLQGMAFCAELDKRHAKPLYDWEKSGQWREGLTWKEAWSSPDLRRKIRRVRQEALKAH